MRQTIALGRPAVPPGAHRRYRRARCLYQTSEISRIGPSARMYGRTSSGDASPSQVSFLPVRRPPCVKCWDAASISPRSLVQCLPFEGATNGPNRPLSPSGSFARKKPADNRWPGGRRGGMRLIGTGRYASIKTPSLASHAHVAQQTADWLHARCRSRFWNVS